jgi:hypothetical protein
MTAHHRPAEDVALASRADRAQVLAHYGGRCVVCGSLDQLELDHLMNDGAAHRRDLRERHLTLEEWLIAEEFPTGVVQILCRPCHQRKTCGTVAPATARRRLAAALRRDAGMPARKGAVTVHLTLSTEAQAQLERLAAQVPNTSKSLIVQGLILRTLTDPDGGTTGQLADLLTTIETRLTRMPDQLQTSLAPMVQAAEAVTSALQTMQGPGQDAIGGRLDKIEALLNQAFPSPSILAERRRHAPRGLRAVWQSLVQVWRGAV